MSRSAGSGHARVPNFGDCAGLGTDDRTHRPDLANQRVRAPGRSPPLQLEIIVRRAIRVVRDATADGSFGTATIGIVGTIIGIGCRSMLGGVAGTGISCRRSQGNRCHDPDRASGFRCETHQRVPFWLEQKCSNRAAWIRDPLRLWCIDREVVAPTGNDLSRIAVINPIVRNVSHPGMNRDLHGSELLLRRHRLTCRGEQGPRPSRSDSHWPIRRAMMSGALPGGKPTTARGARKGASILPRPTFRPDACRPGAPSPSPL
jgi:hypothetical protein